jgi:hypothetical protein
LREWLAKQWNDIKGNVKYGALLVLAGVVLSGVGLLTRGFAWWQDALLLFFFGGILAWAIVATVLAAQRTRPRVAAPSPALIETSLRDRVFILCNELSVYAADRKARPDEDALYEQFKDNPKLFAEHYDAEIQSWDDKVSAGYWFRFRDRAVNLRHELVLNDVRDNDLDTALGKLEQVPKSDYSKVLQTAVERFRYVASSLL